jgi:hypothetical protein
MATVGMSGSDTIKINNRLIADLGDGDVAVLTFPNELAGIKTGKNGNSIYAINESGKQSELVLRVIRGGADDKYFSSQMASQQNNFAGFILMTGEFIKKIGDGTGKVVNDTYITSGGIFTKMVEAKTNVEGDVVQSVAVYTIKFANSPRIIG